MHHKAVLSQTEVTRIINAARAEAQHNGWAVAIAVVDDGGHPLALERLDGCAPIGAYIAMALLIVYNVVVLGILWRPETRRLPIRWTLMLDIAFLTEDVGLNQDQGVLAGQVEGCRRQGETVVQDIGLAIV